MNDIEMITKAHNVAKIAHSGQKRKYTEEDYIYHPIRVASMLGTAGEGIYIITAGLLHDVVEDSDFTIDYIKNEFGIAIAMLVEQVTDVSKKSDGNRADRKHIDIEHLSKASYGGKTIKLADIIDNISSVVKYDKDFAKVYMKEKRDTMEVLVGGNMVLYDRAMDIINGYYENK